MFAECLNIIKINFISLNTKIVKNMKYMFYGCENLETINSLTFDTKNVNDMSYMFYNCKNMKYLDFLSFDLKRNINMSYMLHNCKNYSNLDLSWLEFHNIDTNYIFGYKCNIIYNINKNENTIQLFGNKFVLNNKN